MGSWGIHKPSNMSIKDVLKHDLFRNDELEVLQSSVVGNIVYFAVKYIPQNIVYATVVKTRIDNSIYNNLIYKEMDETMHPYFYDAPPSLIKKLTPTDNENALTWRAECLKRAEVKKVERQKPKVENGMQIQFSRPIEFSNGHKLDTFTVFKEGKSVLFKSGYQFYRIRKWNKLDYQIV
jgi:hypothetical protein